ncbi:uncharacterized protein N7500_009406, partial [Penicillium coprophilum]|uniref:uncharacterized protein n=1 Tax=Penicillium coprophilum TaxID=36646 RepID=UPI0023965CAE
DHQALSQLPRVLEGTLGVTIDTKSLRVYLLKQSIIYLLYLYHDNVFKNVRNIVDHKIQLLRNKTRAL